MQPHEAAAEAGGRQPGAENCVAQQEEHQARRHAPQHACDSIPKW